MKVYVEGPDSRKLAEGLTELGMSHTLHEDGVLVFRLSNSDEDAQISEMIYLVKKMTIDVTLHFLTDDCLREAVASAKTGYVLSPWTNSAYADSELAEKNVPMRPPT